MPYQVIYDAGEQAAKVRSGRLFVVSAIAAVLLGVVLYQAIRSRGRFRLRAWGWLPVGIVTLVGLAAIGPLSLTHEPVEDKAEKLQTGDFEVVEGTVSAVFTRFVNGYWQGHPMFRVGTDEFSYQSIPVQIREGDQVRVTHDDGRVLRLERRTIAPPQEE